ncbi:MAG: UPF0489 family protein [Verrucomicrobiota bacterium]|nr:UPF0489 family protein [Verrucomicrobiota bacterium]
MKRSLGWICASAALAVQATAEITVPIYLEDNHAGSFYWLAEQLELDQPCTLLHFDAHSDASAIFDSDKIREGLRRVSSRAERRNLLETWRRDGAIQCFNWIEPLMPAPFAQVIWVARGVGGIEAARQLDGNLAASPRAAGSLQRVIARCAWMNWKPADRSKDR